MRNGFRSGIFDPVLIIAQIVSLFCFHCVALGGWLLLANFVGGTSTTIDQLFDYHVRELRPLDQCVGHGYTLLKLTRCGF